MSFTEFAALTQEAETAMIVGDDASLQRINQRVATMNGQFVVIDGKLYLKVLDGQGVPPSTPEEAQHGN